MGTRPSSSPAATSRSTAHRRTPPDGGRSCDRSGGTPRPSPTDGEVPLSDRRDVLSVEGIHPGADRASARPGEEVVHGARVSFDLELDAAVGQIPREPADAELLRLRAGGIAEADTLH